ncbi:MAG: hypothetical protein JO218_07405 [Burkholderiales bacterium]|nr:hypothetical protein [Burkholderiales bacterium]
MARTDNRSWLSRVLEAFSALFRTKSSSNAQRSTIQNTTKMRQVAGHWPVWVELSKSTQESHKPKENSIFTLKFSASDGPLLKSLKITAREFTGSYVPEKKSFVVQVPERLVQELMRHQETPAFVEGFMDGETLGVRRFTIPLSY